MDSEQPDPCLPAFTDLQVALIELHTAALELQTTALEDQPAQLDTAALDRLGDDIVELVGWVQEARFALVPATPGPGSVSTTIAGRALIGVQRALDRTASVVQLRLVHHEPNAHLQRMCRLQGREWTAWLRELRGSIGRLDHNVTVARAALVAAWTAVMTRLGAPAEVPTNGR